jgi:hypothetical protein
MAVLVLLLAIFVPLYICMPPWCDMSFFDVCASAILRGEPFCKEIEIHGTAGAVFIHTAIRSLVGWGSVQLRIADLCLVAATIYLLVGRLLPGDQGTSSRWWAAVVLSLFYFSTTEWSHCQPDMRMLLLCLVALCLRQRQAGTLLYGLPAGRFTQRAFWEGVFWGLAFLVKPFAALPAVGCYGLTLALCWPQQRRLWRALVLDAGGVLAGGLAVGVLTLAWFYFSGNLPYYIAGNQGGWNEEYFKSSPSGIQRMSVAFVRMWPWSLIHFAALPAAVLALDRVFRARSANPSAPDRNDLSRALLAAFYLGWFAQANFIQWQFEYHLAPGMLLGLTLLLGESWLKERRAVRWLLLPGFLLWAVSLHPLLQPQRLALWDRCWSEGSSPKLRDRLTINPEDIGATSWVDLEQVAQFLKKQHVRDREVTCYGTSALHLYQALDIKPSTRYVMIHAWLLFFPSHQAEILHEVQSGPQRFVVADLVQLLRMSPAQYHQPVRIPDAAPSYPWKLREVFRAGRYLVFKVQ